MLGLNSFTEIRNVGSAEIKGAETDVTWRPDDHWTVNAAASYTDAKITQDYCGQNDPATQIPVTVCPAANDANPPQAPAGTALPVTPKLKASATVRYEFQLADFKAHLQGSVQGQTFSWADLRVIAPDPITGVDKPVRGALGKQRGYATADFTTGLEKDNWFIDLSLTNAFDERADLYRYDECTPQVCGAEPYIVTNRPRTIAIKFGQKF